MAGSWQGDGCPLPTGRKGKQRGNCSGGSRLLATSCWEAALGLILSTTGPAGAGGVGEGRNFLITQVTGKGWVR